MSCSSSSSNPAHAGRITSRQELQAAIAKAVELRALHAALLQQGSCAGSPALIRLPQVVASPSLSKAPLKQFTASDYPVFAPSYEDPFQRPNSICPSTRSLSDNWSNLERERAEIIIDEERETETLTRDGDSFSPNNFSSSNSEPPMNHHLMDRVHCTNHHLMDPVRHLSQTPLSLNAPQFFPKSVSTCNSCKPATINKSVQHPSVPINNDNNSNSKKQQKGQILSWLFHKSSKKKTKTRSATSPNTIGGSENMSQLLKEWGVFSLESLKRELMEANENRDSALAEVSEMKGSLTELTTKLVSLESYCEELKKALKNTQCIDRSNLSKRTKSISLARDNDNYNNNCNNYLPVSHEVMVEGFLQVVSEARLSVKQFCKALMNHMDELDGSSSDLIERINILLQSDLVLSNNSRSSKLVLYHLEAIINQSLYQDFENCVFRKNGCPKNLDPKKEIQENFQNFVALRNLSWNEVLKKGTKFYSEDFSKFCDQKMSLILSNLNWARPWPENILQSFFVASKCIWLLHLLAFSFNPPLVILRVEENRKFDNLYMEEIILERQTGRVAGRVKTMVVPGFYVQDKVLKCRVLCTYRS